jgi:hypothetical protein
VVLQERIELSTSPLPRECSTTELLQHPKRPKRAGFPATANRAWQGEPTRSDEPCGLPVRSLAKERTRCGEVFEQSDGKKVKNYELMYIKVTQHSHYDYPHYGEP